MNKREIKEFNRRNNWNKLIAVIAVCIAINVLFGHEWWTG